MLFLRKKSGMNKEITAQKGLKMNQSGWGTAVINGVSARNCVRVVQYEFGYQIEMMKIFGGGKLWLPSEEITIKEETERRFLFPATQVIISGENKVTLYGRLTQVIK